MNSEIKTNLGRGTSVPVFKAPVRSLTAGEIAMLQLVFKNSIDYSRVMIHGEGHINKLLDVPVTPRGETYYPPQAYQPDYSKSPLSIIYKDHSEIYQKNTFVHEMAHVWQYQHGMSVAARAIGVQLCSRVGLCRDPYFYELKESMDLADYAVEQQAQIIADYHSLLYLSHLALIGFYLSRNNVELKSYFSKYVGNMAKMDAECRRNDFKLHWSKKYESVLSGFLKNPGEYNW